MRVAVTKPLFAWDCLEDNPSLRTIREFLRAIPDGRLLESLRSHRGRGRDEYPVEAEWGDPAAACEPRIVPGGIEAQ
jgi:hypothetical protein